MVHRMEWCNDRARYGAVSRILHWLMALLIFVMLLIGWTIDRIPREWKMVSLGIHKSLGIIILVLVIARFGWRLYNAPPPFPKFMARWEKTAAVAVHYLLYGFLLAMPLTGWAMTSAKGRPVVFLGIIQLPGLVDKDRELGKWLEEIHGDLASLLTATVILHAMAALHHYFIKKTMC